MKNPRTVHEILDMLEDYHRQRGRKYERLAEKVHDPNVRILLQHLGQLERESVEVIHDEAENTSPAVATYLDFGPSLDPDAVHANDCLGDAEPSVEDVVVCALAADPTLDELLDRLAACTAAPSVASLAERLQALELTKRQQISKYTRND